MDIKMSSMKPRARDSSSGPGHDNSSPLKKRTKLSSSPRKSSPKDVPAGSGVCAEAGLFSGVSAFVLQAGLGKARSEVFKKQLMKQGAIVQSTASDQTTHIIVDEEMTFPRFCRIMKYETSGVPKGLKVIKARWLSSCLSEDRLLDHEEFLLIPVRTQPQKIKLFPPEDDGNIAANVATEIDNDLKGDQKDVTDVINQPGPSNRVPVLTSPQKNAAAARSYDSDDSNYVASDDDEGGRGGSDEDNLLSEADSSSNVSTPNTSPAKLPRGNWVCSRPSTAQKSGHHNQHITEKLELLMKAYENTQDRWRALGYKKAISALKNYGKEVTTWEEASAIPGIGTKMADKIWEIIESGHLRKIDFVCKGEDMEAIQLFNDVWGAGPTVAREWVQQGFRTLSDLREKAKLTKQQQIGLKHYDEFLDRMPRTEAGDIEKTVRETAQTLFPGMLAVVCGSYRRGKQTCGDVDVLISHPDGKTHKGALSKILDALRQTGKRVHALATLQAETWRTVELCTALNHACAMGVPDNYVINNAGICQRVTVTHHTLKRLVE